MKFTNVLFELNLVADVLLKNLKAKKKGCPIKKPAETPEYRSQSKTFHLKKNERYVKNYFPFFFDRILKIGLNLQKQTIPSKKISYFFLV